MIDRRALITSAGAVLAAASAGPAGAAVSPLDYSWRQIAQSRFIVIGVTRPPEGSEPGKAEGRSILVPVSDVTALKGAPPSPLVLDCPNIAAGILDTEAPWRFAGRPAVIFLADQAGEPPRVWMTHLEAILPPEPEVLEFVKREVAAQAKYLAAWRPDREVPHYASVKGVIDWLAAISPTAPNAAELQAAGFARLESLGERAASAMVAQMNDRRPLAVRHLKLGSTPIIHGERTWQPELVIDAMTAMLEQVTGQSFGSPYRQPVDSQRQLAFDGWRLYVGRHERGLP